MNDVLIALLKGTLTASLDNLPNEASVGDVYHIKPSNKIYIKQSDGSWSSVPFIDQFVWKLNSKEYLWTSSGLSEKPAPVTTTPTPIEQVDYSSDITQLYANDSQLVKLIDELNNKPSISDPNQVSVKTFGAKGDAITDDSPAFNKAFAWMAEQPGRSLQIPASKGYRLASTIKVNSPRLRLQSKIVSAGMSSPLIVDFNGPVFSFSTLTYNVDFESLCAYPSKTVSSNVITDALFYFPNGNCDSNFMNCRYDTNPDNGVKGATFYYCGTGKLMDGINFTNCYAYNRVCNYQIGSGSSVYIIGGRGIGNFPSDYSYGLKMTGGMGGIFVTQTDFIAHGEGVRHGNESGQSNREIFYSQVCTDGCYIGRNILDGSYTSDQGIWAASCDVANVNFYPDSDDAVYVINGGTIFNAGAFKRAGSAYGLSLNHRGRILCTGVEFRNNRGRALSVNSSGRSYYSVFSSCNFVANGDTSLSGTCQIQLAGKVKLEGGYLANNSSVTSLVVDPGSSTLVKVRNVEGLADKL